jgi:hypothetical protein
MKKLFAIIAANLILSLSPAFAAPVEFSGDVTVKYEVDTSADGSTESGVMTTFTLKGEKKIGKGLSLYARLGAQYAGNPVLGDFNRDVYAADTKAVAAIDQFGLIYKTKTLTFNLGRQDAVIGINELLYKRSAENIGNNAFVDGLSVNGSIGVIDVMAVTARENNLWQDNNSFYAVRAGYNLSKNTNVGLTFARYHYFNAETTHHWGADATVTFGKHSILAEYARSNSSEENNAYAVTWNYKFNDKTAVYVTHFRAETNGVMGGQSEYDTNNRGFYYGVTHAFSGKFSMELVFKDQVAMTDGGKNSKVELKLLNTF